MWLYALEAHRSTYRCALKVFRQGFRQVYLKYHNGKFDMLGWIFSFRHEEKKKNTGANFMHKHKM